MHIRITKKNCVYVVICSCKLLPIMQYTQQTMCDVVCALAMSQCTTESECTMHKLFYSV